MLIKLDAAREELGHLHIQNRRLWQNPRNKLVKALMAVGLTNSPLLGEEPLEEVRGPVKQSAKILHAPQKKKPVVRRRAKDNLYDSEAEASDSDQAASRHGVQPPCQQRSCSPIIREDREDEVPLTPLPKVRESAEVKPKTAYSETGWARSKTNTVATKPTTPRKHLSVGDVVPKSEIKQKNIGTYDAKWTNDAEEEDTSEQILCSIMIDGKVYNNINISKASIESALQRKVPEKRHQLSALPSLSAEPVSTKKISSRNKQSQPLASQTRSSSHPTRPTSAGASRRGCSPMSFKSANKSSDDCDDGKYANAKSGYMDGHVVIGGQSRSSKSMASPRVKVKKSERNINSFNPTFEPSLKNVPDAYQVQRGVWNGAAGGPGWIGLDQPHESMPAQSRYSSVQITNNCATFDKAYHDNSSKWAEEDNPFACRRGKIRNTNECSTPGNMWSPEMAFARYGDPFSGKMF